MILMFALLCQALGAWRFADTEHEHSPCRNLVH